ncbi:unnamed protein product [Trifolium pratense]|uniref:Uncharacterized protein n=1 Tax=Trifolium pratense TaxID=57577 RepID=A0ACB0M8Y3_TRIPR|nr:unnamed protein product [Trifolium pratense]
MQVVLSLIAAGSEGATKQQLLDFLQFKSTEDLNSFASYLVSSALNDASLIGGPRLSFMNGVWVEQTLPLLPSFKQIASTDYKANLASVDFLHKADEVANEVNLWVERKTNDLIKELLPSGLVDSYTCLIFANALYFNGEWDSKFDVSKTKDYDFHLPDGSAVKVKIIVNFLCIFTFQMQKMDLSALVENVTSRPSLLHPNFRLSQNEVGDFRIPKFDISFGLETTDMLKKLGVNLPFFPGGLAKMVDSHVGQRLFVSHTFHKSFIKIDEDGSEAAAASVAFMSKGIPSRLDFVADHPFLFLIRDDMTGTVLFIGQVLNPLDMCLSGCR